MASLKVGDKVMYVNECLKAQRGMIKSIDAGRIFVVFNCSDNWENYQNYTASLVDEKYLFEGWDFETNSDFTCIEHNDLDKDKCKSQCEFCAKI